MDAISPFIRLDPDDPIDHGCAVLFALRTDWQIDPVQCFARHLPTHLLFQIFHPPPFTPGDPDSSIPAEALAARLVHICDGNPLPPGPEITRIGRQALHAFAMGHNFPPDRQGPVLLPLRPDPRSYERSAPIESVDDLLAALRDNMPSAVFWEESTDAFFVAAIDLSPPFEERRPIARISPDDPTSGLFDQVSTAEAFADLDTLKQLPLRCGPHENMWVLADAAYAPPLPTSSPLDSEPKDDPTPAPTRPDPNQLRFPFPDDEIPF